jgi:hypothetical protein
MWILQNMEKLWSPTFANTMQGMSVASYLQKSLWFTLYCDFAASEMWLFQKTIPNWWWYHAATKTRAVRTFSLHTTELHSYSLKPNFQGKMSLGWRENDPSVWYQLDLSLSWKYSPSGWPTFLSKYTSDFFWRVSPVMVVEVFLQFGTSTRSSLLLSSLQITRKYSRVYFLRFFCGTSNTKLLLEN